MNKRALVTGITGQDGSYLSEFLLAKGYEVHGIVRRSASLNTGRIDHIFDRLTLHFGDLADATSLIRVLQQVEPDEIYNLACQSHVRVSFDVPEYTEDIAACGAVRLLEATRMLKLPARLYQASSSEMFGSSPPPQNENTPFHPRSPYGISKTYGYWIARNYREAHGMHVSNGIMFNHESPRRGETFLPRKACKAAARIAQGLQNELKLGNLEARRDWGFAGDYVKAMWLMLQKDEPGDYVIATGQSHSVRDLLECAFSHVGLDWRRYVGYDQRYERPAEVDVLCGDATKAKFELGWRPQVTFEQLVHMIVDSEMEIAARMPGALTLA
jgi:GDPmannose 4,6-dehydratase